MDRPNSQTCMDGMIPCMCYIIFGEFDINATAFCLGQCRLHLLLLKSSMVKRKLTKCMKFLCKNLKESS